MLQAIKNLLPRRLQEQGISTQVEATQVVEALKQEVISRFGLSAVDAFRKVSLRDNTLEVLLTSSALASELRMIESDLASALQVKFGKAYRLRIFA